MSYLLQIFLKEMQCLEFGIQSIIVVVEIFLCFMVFTRSCHFHFSMLWHPLFLSFLSSIWIPCMSLWKSMWCQYNFVRCYDLLVPSLYVTLQPPFCIFIWISCLFLWDMYVTYPGTELSGPQIPTFVTFLYEKKIDWLRQITRITIVSSGFDAGFPAPGILVK